MSLVRKEEAEKDHTNYAQQLIDLHDQYAILLNLCCIFPNKLSVCAGILPWFKDLSEIIHFFKKC